MARAPLLAEAEDDYAAVAEADCIGGSMEYRKLGQTGLLVSELCLGTMTFGNEADEQTSKKITDRFGEAGGNFVDAANVCSRGISEEITGRVIRDYREDVVLATKFRFPMGAGPNDQ